MSQNMTVTNKKNKQGIMVHTCNPCVQNTEVGGILGKTCLRKPRKRTGNPRMLDLDKNTRFSKAL